MENANLCNHGLELIFGRRSIRVFETKAVSEEAIQKLLDAAIAAPSAAAKDPWRFVVITRRALLAELANALPHGRMLATAPLGIAVCGSLDHAHDRQISYMLQDCSAAIQNLLLCAHGLALGACWLGVHPREDRMASVSRILNLPSSIVPVSCVAVGSPAETKEARTRFNPDYVRYEREPVQ